MEHFLISVLNISIHHICTDNFMTSWIHWKEGVTSPTSLKTCSRPHVQLLGVLLLRLHAYYCWSLSHFLRFPLPQLNVFWYLYSIYRFIRYVLITSWLYEFTAKKMSYHVNRTLIVQSILLFRNGRVNHCVNHAKISSPRAISDFMSNYYYQVYYWCCMNDSPFSPHGLGNQGTMCWTNVLYLCVSSQSWHEVWAGARNNC